jgi:hypothetical protein
LFFSRVAATDDVSVLLCELSNGMPDPNKILARSNVVHANLRVATLAGTTDNVLTTFHVAERIDIETAT